MLPKIEDALVLDTITSTAQSLEDIASELVVKIHKRLYAVANRGSEIEAAELSKG